MLGLAAKINPKMAPEMEREAARQIPRQLIWVAIDLGQGKSPPRFLG
jgi:hypothetical protein